MLKEFVLPDLGEGIVECELVEWLVKEGDSVLEDQPIADVMTDKALVQIPAVHPGTISKLYYKVGEMARVGEPLFAIRLADTADTPKGDAEVDRSAASDEASDDARGVQTSVAISQRAAAPAQPIAAASADTAEQRMPTESSEISAASTKSVASPAVRRLARELCINLNQVPGSGDKGRVYKQDLVAYQEQLHGSAADPVPPQGAASHCEPLRGVTAAMARQMSLSLQTIAHFSMSEQVDFTELNALKRQLAAASDLPKLTLMPFLLKALSVALAEFPLLNSQLHEQRREVEFYHHHHIGVAVDTPQGLLVPVLRHVEQASILTLAKQLEVLLRSAREGTLSRQQLTGGTFTLSNVGAIGGTTATPIINYPQSAILALGRIQSLPRFDAAGQVTARDIADISWSADHRIIDGATLAKFSNRFVQLLQQPSHLLINLR